MSLIISIVIIKKMFKDKFCLPRLYNPFILQFQLCTVFIFIVFGGGLFILDIELSVLHKIKINFSLRLLTLSLLLGLHDMLVSVSADF